MVESVLVGCRMAQAMCLQPQLAHQGRLGNANRATRLPFCFEPMYYSTFLGQFVRLDVFGISCAITARHLTFWPHRLVRKLEKAGVRSIQDISTFSINFTV